MDLFSEKKMLPKRKQLRLSNYDYSQQGYYFITLCAKNRMCLFEEHLKLKEIVSKEFYKLPERFPYIQLDEFVIMPNHIHFIIHVEVDDHVGAGDHRVREGDHHVGAGFMPARRSLGDIIGAYKSLCVHRWLEYIKENNISVLGSFWQRNYYERIVRNEIELNRFREYIRNNPINWEKDINQLTGLKVN